MPSRKQRRRRQKLQRHEYEYVVETEEGEEVVVERAREVEKAKEPARRAERQPIDRRGRPVPKPTIRRVLRRTAIFGPLLLIVVFLLGGDLPTSVKIQQFVVLLLFFIPFSYMVDVLVYSLFMRRQRRQSGR